MNGYMILVALVVICAAGVGVASLALARENQVRACERVNVFRGLVNEDRESRGLKPVPVPNCPSAIRLLPLPN
jgi:putative ubiquitin-RnfH superfamily antitoxin RatB of RatAB toxin-antitoxin module